MEDTIFKIVSPAKVSVNTAVALRYLVEELHYHIHISKNQHSKKVSLLSIVDVVWLKIDKGDLIKIYFDEFNDKITKAQKQETIDKIKELLLLYE